MTDLEDRMAELELRYVRQQDLLEQLNDELVKAAQSSDLLEKRVKRLEETVEALVAEREIPHERPPHY